MYVHVCAINSACLRPPHTRWNLLAPGLPLDFRHGAKLVKNTGVVASGGKALHARLLEAIAASLKPPESAT